MSHFYFSYFDWFCMIPECYSYLWNYKTPFFRKTVLENEWNESNLMILNKNSLSFLIKMYQFYFSYFDWFRMIDACYSYLWNMRRVIFRETVLANQWNESNFMILNQNSIWFSSHCEIFWSLILIDSVWSLNVIHICESNKTPSLEKLF